MLMSEATALSTAFLVATLVCSREAQAQSSTSVSARFFFISIKNTCSSKTGREAAHV